MKRYSIILLAVIFLTLCACGREDSPETVNGETPAENPGQIDETTPIEETPAPEEPAGGATEEAAGVTAELDEENARYQTLRQIIGIINDNDRKWMAIQLVPTGDYEVENYTGAEIYTLENENRTFIAYLTKYNWNSKSNDVIFSYGINGVSMEHYTEIYDSFMENDVAVIWDILGQLYGEPESIAELQQQCMEYINENTWDSGGNVLWCGREADVHCSASLFWNAELEKYILEDIVLKNNISVKISNRSAGLDWTNSYLDNYTVSDIPLTPVTAPEGENPLISYSVKGRLEDIQPVTDELDGLDSSAITYSNTDLYQKAQLVDDTGSITVYIPPTSMTEEELSEELLHVIVVTPGETPYFIVAMSIYDYEDIYS